ncbi:hypothetical protein CARUB_v10021474mg [Capsella rubella]|uniref:Defensin-like protein n=1 Tax=Capsella rubella TaxID=81985 RepID=R0I7E6_9BRAS|nr:putative defensin-like protein 262 [Capsella rubella]EOA33980.1 hypothetical protein CARUB_v10021474mg [Capsella rubella]
MEQTSLKLVFLVSLTVIAFCSSLGDTREIVEEEANCINGKCPEGKKNCNCLQTIAQVPLTDYDRPCNIDSDCNKFCPPQCQLGTCVCRCDFGCTCTCY